MARTEAKEILFDGSSDSSGEDDDQQEQAHLRVDEEFAKRFEHNSRRAELHRLKDKHPEVAARFQARELEGGDTESSSSEEEDEGELSPETEQEWAQALLKIKSKDPSIYDSQTRLFHESATSDDSQPDEEAPDGEDDGINTAEECKKDKKTKKKKLLREILYEQAVAEGGDATEDPEATETDFERKKRLRSGDSATNSTLAYDKEQQMLRDALVEKSRGADAGSSEEEEGDSDHEHGGLKVRRHVAEESSRAAPTAAVSAEEDLNAFFQSKDSRQDSGAAFLQHYLQQRLWAQDGDDAGESAAVDTGAGGAGLFGGDRTGGAHGMHEAVDNEEDEFLDRADRFEHAYNFRSEEPQGAQIATFPRRIEGLGRQEDSKRKRQREAKRVREEERQQQRKEEVKRLKNLKKREVGDALSQLVDVSGKGAPDRNLLQKLLDSDFDPAAWDQHMSAAFDEEYYAEAECEDDVTAAAPDVMKEVNAWHAVAGKGDASAGEKTFDQVHKKVTGKDAGGLLPETDYVSGAELLGDPQEAMEFDQEGAEDSDASEDSEEDEKAEGDMDEDALAEQKAASRDKVHDLLRDYYKLDHEDEVGGVRTRFRYRQVEPIRDGLLTEEILSLPDRDLNSIVGLRKLAPYREDVTVVRPNYKALAEARQKLVDEGLFIDKSKSKGSKSAKMKAAKKSSTGGHASSLGVKKDEVAKKAGAWAAANTGGSGAVGVKAAHGSKAKKVKQSESDAHAQGGVGGTFGKKKRPGPALRRAMKEASAAQEASGGGMHDATAAEQAEEATQKTKQEKNHCSSELEADVKASRGKKVERGGSDKRKTLHVMTEDEKARARAASYAGVALPTARHDSGKQSMSKVSEAYEKKLKAGESLDQSEVLVELTKAARKNMKRKMKRMSTWAGSQEGAAQA